MLRLLTYRPSSFPHPSRPPSVISVGTLTFPTRPDLPQLLALHYRKSVPTPNSLIFAFVSPLQDKTPKTFHPSLDTSFNCKITKQTKSNQEVYRRSKIKKILFWCIIKNVYSLTHSSHPRLPSPSPSISSSLFSSIDQFVGRFGESGEGGMKRSELWTMDGRKIRRTPWILPAPQHLYPYILWYIMLRCSIGFLFSFLFLSCLSLSERDSSTTLVLIHFLSLFDLPPLFFFFSSSRSSPRARSILAPTPSTEKRQFS